MLNVQTLSVDWDLLYAPENFEVNHSYEVRREYVAYCYNSECIKRNIKRGRPKRIAIKEAKITDTYCPRCGHTMKWATIIKKLAS